MYNWIAGGKLPRARLARSSTASSASAWRPIRNCAVGEVATREATPSQAASGGHRAGAWTSESTAASLSWRSRYLGGVPAELLFDRAAFSAYRSHAALSLRLTTSAGPALLANVRVNAARADTSSHASSRTQQDAESVLSVERRPLSAYLLGARRYASARSCLDATCRHRLRAQQLATAMHVKDAGFDCRMLLGAPLCFEDSAFPRARALS